MVMRTVRYLSVCYFPAWNRWPTSDDKDFSKDKLRLLYDGVRRINGEMVRLITKAFPVYCCYDANGWKFPSGLNDPGDINNTIEADPRVVEKMTHELVKLADDFDVIGWVHAAHCLPAIAAEVLPKYKLSVLHFGDDCPGSSETKSFPVVRFFDAVINRMLVWNYSTGELVPELYAKHGFKGRCYHNIGGRTSGLSQWIEENDFGIDKKLARPALPIDLVWLGSLSMGAERKALLTKLNETAVDQSFSSRLHGWHMRDGIYGQPATSRLPGIDAARLYNDSTMGLNYPVSSYFNSRLFDLPMLGVVPVMHDPHRELEAAELVPWEHYVPYDGTAPGLYNTVEDMLTRPKMLKSIARQAHEAAFEREKRLGPDETFNRMLGDNMDRL